MNKRTQSIFAAVASIGCAMGLSALAPHVALAQDAPEAVQAGEAQTWVGDIHLPGGMKLGFSANLKPDGKGGYTGALSIPSQDAENVPLRDVVVTAEEVKFTMVAQGSPPQAWAIFEVALKPDGSVDSASMTQFSQQFPVTIRRMAEGEDPMADARPQTPRPPFPYSQRELSIVNGADGTRLVGTLFTPGKPAAQEIVASERHPAVIFITGSGPQDRDETIMGHKPFLVIADHLARNGVASFRMDDRGVGGSTGDVFKSTIYDFASDIQAAFGALKIQPDIDPNRIGLIGHSEGGAIAPLVASDVPEVRFIVLLAGTGVPGREVMTHQAGLLMKAAGADEESLAAQEKAHRALMDAVTTGADDAAIDAAIRELIKAQALEQKIPEDQLNRFVEAQKSQLTTPWLHSFLIYDPRVPLRSVRCPVLALNGERDLQVDPAQNLSEIEKVLKEAGHMDVTAQVMPGLNHLFQPSETGSPLEYGEIRETFDTETLALMTTWIRKRVGLE